ncbi:MAG: MFS transporter [Actinobacteria bacterium]|nr:MFS transporter [Actinomycetota bacterium]MCL5447538.1 MFS transporter [Actinomycetota bacterium]
MNAVSVATTDPSHSRGRTLAFTSLGHFMNDGMVFFIPVVADILAKSHGASAVLVTAILTVFYVASAGFGLIVGRVADSLGRRGLMIAFGLLILSLGLLGFYLSLAATAGISSDMLALAAALVAGIGSSFYHPLGGSVIQLAFSAESRGKALGVNGAFGSLGRALYPSLFFIVAALAISKANTVIIFAAFGILSAAVIAYGIGSLSRARPALIKASGNGGHEKTATRSGTGDNASGNSHGSAQTIRSMLTKSVVALTAIAFIRSMAFIGIVSWVPIYLTTQKHLGLSSQLGYTVTIMFAGGIVGQPVFGQLADRFDKRIVLALNTLGSALTILTYISFSGVGAIISLIFFGFFTFSGFPLLLSLVSDYVPRRSTTTGNALVWGLGSTGGQALGPLVVGLLTFGSYSHLSTAFIIMASLAAATVLATPLMSKTDSRVKMPLFG